MRRRILQAVMHEGSDNAGEWDSVPFSLFLSGGSVIVGSDRRREESVEELAKLITAGAWGLVALTLAAGIPFAWRKVLAYIEAKTQLSLADAVRRMLDE